MCAHAHKQINTHTHALTCIIIPACRPAHILTHACTNTHMIVHNENDVICFVRCIDQNCVAQSVQSKDNTTAIYLTTIKVVLHYFHLILENQKDSSS